MLCNRCIHCDVCKYKHTYIKTMEALAWRLKELVVSEEIRSILGLPDILCTHCRLSPNVEDTSGSHDDHISVPPPHYPMVYCSCQCDDSTIT